MYKAYEDHERDSENELRAEIRAGRIAFLRELRTLYLEEPENETLASTLLAYELKI